MIQDKNNLLLMDSHLEGKFSAEEATVVVNLAFQCLQYEPKELPKTKDLVDKLSPLQTRHDVRISLFHMTLFSCNYISLLLAAF